MAEGKNREIKITIPEELLSLCIPEKTIEQLFKVKKEMLLTLRSFIDARIEAIEKKEAKKAKPKQKIKIE